MSRIRASLSPQTRRGAHFEVLKRKNKYKEPTANELAAQTQWAAEQAEAYHKVQAAEAAKKAAEAAKKRSRNEVD